LLTKEEQLRLLGDLASADGLPAKATLDDLNPANFEPGELWMAVVLAKRGWPVREEILPMLSLATIAQLSGSDTEERPAIACLPTITADELLAREFPEPTWAIPDLLPAGLAILAGRSKVGKSWLTLQIACAVGCGGHALGRSVDAERVLYIALEDNGATVQDRMRKQRWPPGVSVDFLHQDNADALGDLAQDGLSSLTQHIRARGYRLVIVDTLSRSLRGDQNDAETMTAVLSPLQRLALAQDCAIVFIDHHNKGPASDRVCDILGSTAKGAVADTIWALYREKGKSGARLAITGRRVREQELELAWDPLCWCWQCQGETNKVQINDTREAILAYLFTVDRAQVGEIVKCTKIKDKGNAHHELQNLVSAFYVERIEEGRSVFYRLSAEERERREREETER